MAAGAQTSGWRQLRKHLRAAGDDLSDLKDANADAARIAAAEIKRRAPDDTGRLKSTIRSAGTKGAGVVRVGNNSKVRYAGPIVWGWGRKHIPSNPFPSRGARAAEPRWRGVYEDYIARVIKRIKGQ